MNRSEQFLQEIRRILDKNILDWWLGMKDPRGGFYGEADFAGRPVADAPRGVILNARIIWTFSAASLALGRKDCLLAARHAAEWFLQHFCDHRYGGVYWSVSPSGEPHERKKQLYSQAFAIYGMSEFYRCSGDKEALNAAVHLFRTVERYFRDAKNGGYREALARDFSPLEDMSLSEHDINADKTMNSHLHLLEAYAALYRVWPDEQLKMALAELLERVCLFMPGEDGHLRLYFTGEWSVLPGAVSFGHDIETSWLGLECAFALRDFDMTEKVRRACARLGRAGNEGCLEDGSFLYERPCGEVSRQIDYTRQWWVQAEAVVGNLWLWKYHADGPALERAFRCWDYIKEHFVDSRGGEWYFNLLPDGTPDPSLPKAGFWKCPYHNARMCLEILKIFE